MHRSLPVVLLEVDSETEVISKVGKAAAIERLPVGVGVKGGIPNRGDLNDWWQGRSIPASRQNIRRALNTLGLSTTDKLPAQCFGLSLSDQYWVNPTEKPLKWDEINFFHNTFSQDVGDALFGNVPAVDATAKLNLVSPNNTSDGWLKKKWTIINDKRCLIKGGSDPFWQQPINEVMATIIMQRLNVPHVAYILTWEDGFPYSVCENFITAETELVSAFCIHNTKRITQELYHHYIDCCQTFGIPNIQESLDQMLTVDFLIANSDRHLNNFGAVRNADTLEWISAAPLYDNGSSLWYNHAIINEATPCKSQPFTEFHDTQIKLVKDFSWLNMSDLCGVDEEFYELLKLSPRISNTRRDELCLALKRQVACVTRYF